MFVVATATTSSSSLVLSTWLFYLKLWCALVLALDDCVRFAVTLAVFTTTTRTSPIISSMSVCMLSYTLDLLLPLLFGTRKLTRHEMANILN